MNYLLNFDKSKISLFNLKNQKSYLDDLRLCLNESHKRHTANLFFYPDFSTVLVPFLKKQPTLEICESIFSKNKLWDTEENNSLLLYYSEIAKSYYFYADRGILKKIPSSIFPNFFGEFSKKNSKKTFLQSAINKIFEMTIILETYFPKNSISKNELV
jgi:uncharacterized membrane protein